jgi:putative DNA primase/helicase
VTIDYAKIFDEFSHPPAPGIVLQRVSDIPAQKLSWLWPGRIPLGKLSLFAGDPGLGKSLVTLDIAARVTCGRDWPDGTTNSQPGSVIILSAEDDPGDTMRPRLETAGADLSKINIVQAVRRANRDGSCTVEPFSLECDLVALQDAAASLNDVRLIIIDPISAYLGDTDSHVNAKVRRLLAPLAGLAQGLRVAAIAVDHLSKSNRPALYRPNGSIAFTAAARAVWLFAKGPDDDSRRLMLPGKMNLSPDQQGLSYVVEARSEIPAVLWGEAVRLSADEVLQPETVEQRSERREAVEWLKERLSEGSVPRTEVEANAKVAGIAWRTLRRAKDDLAVISEKDGFKGGWLWRLPVPEDAHQDSKMSSPEKWTPSPQLDTFGADRFAKRQVAKAGNGRRDPGEYVLDSQGPGCTCCSCEGHFGTVAGWRAHILRGRCLKQ